MKTYYYHFFIRHRRMLLSLLVVTSAIVFSATSVFAYSDWMNHWLWVNDETRNAYDKQVVILPTTTSTGNSNLTNFVSGWLGIHLETNSNFFVQAGIIADGTGVRWFAYTDATATCFSNGESEWGGMGCVGEYDDHVGVNQWSRFELVNYNQGFWIARVWDQNNNPVDIAKLHINELTATHVYGSSEQSYANSNEPHLPMGFRFYNPQYQNVWQPFKHWPSAGGVTGRNHFAGNTDNASRTVCPPHRFFLHQLNPVYWSHVTAASGGSCFNQITF